MLAAASVLSLAVGSGDVAPHDVVAGLFGPDRSVHGQMLVQEVRLPRTLAGLLAGAAWGAYVRGTGRVDFVERLGFRNNPAIEAKAGSAFSVPVSEENLNLLDADLTVMSPIGTTAAKISSDPLFKAVPSVKKGHSVVFDDRNISQAFATDSVLSVDYALEHVVPLFASALK